MKKILISILLILGLQQTSICQKTDTSYSKLKKQIVTNLHFLENYQPFTHQNDEINPNTVAEKTTWELTQLLKFEDSRELDSLPIKNLHLDVFTNDSTRIRIYTFGHATRGMSHWQSYSVMQWSNRCGKLLSFNLSKILSMSFTNIYVLKKDSVSSLYLLIGNSPESAIHLTIGTFVFKFEGDYFFTNYHAFANEYALIETNIDISFDSNKKILVLHSNFGPSNDITRIDYYDHPDSLADKKLAALLNKNFDYGTNTIYLFWNGKHFVNITQPWKPDE